MQNQTTTHRLDPMGGIKLSMRETGLIGFCRVIVPLWLDDYWVTPSTWLNKLLENRPRVHIARGNFPT